MDKIKQTFELSSRQVQLKQIKDSEFLFLEIKAINTDYPNRNGSHFTKESLYDAISTCYDKPILGSWNDGDFGSHDGEWNVDNNTESPYWNTKNGEHPLGFIREKDIVKVEKRGDKDWLIINCVLWVQYCWEQVSRLLIKDKKHKKVSVEIEILDSHLDEQGIIIIDKFKLLGITILGTKNGKPVVEGIEGASLDVLSEFDSDEFLRQKQTLCFAYQKLDGEQHNDVGANILPKEVNAKVEDVLNPQATSGEEVQNFEGNPQGGEPGQAVNAQGEGNPSTNAFEGCGDDNRGGSVAQEAHEEGGHEPEGGEGGEGGEEHGDGEGCGCGEGHEDHSCGGDPNKGDNAEGEPVGCEHCAELEAKCSDLETRCVTLEAKCSEYEERCAKYEERCAEYEARCSEYEARCAEYAKLQANFEEVERDLGEVRAQLKKYSLLEMRSKAEQLMEGCNLPKSVYDAIVEESANGTIATEEDLEAKVSLAVFAEMKKTTRKQVTNNFNFSMPIGNAGGATLPKEEPKVSALTGIVKTYGGK